MSRRILVIDDNASLRRVCRMVLERAGYVVDEAGDGTAGLRAMAQATADLVLADVHLPGVEGTAVIDELRRRHPAAGVIAMSGGGSAAAEAAVDSWAELGMSGGLRKPFSAQELLATVAEGLRRAGAGPGER